MFSGKRKIHHGYKWLEVDSAQKRRVIEKGTIIVLVERTIDQ